ncbi:MAG: hypothetical protein ACLFN2_07500 [Bacteroidales bacterium]
MASKKTLKKDINFLVDEVVGTCLMRQEMHPNDKEEQKKMDEKIKEMLHFREEMITRVNKPDIKENAQTLKSYYHGLYEELLDKVNGVFDELGSKE